MAKKVTLKDIAQKTGVTAASVSMILNGKELSRFTPETVSRVLAAAREMQYVTPAEKHTPKQIAIISPSVNNPYHTTIIMGRHLQHLLESADGAGAAAAAGNAPGGGDHLRHEPAAGRESARG